MSIGDKSCDYEGIYFFHPEGKNQNRETKNNNLLYKL